jgi:alkanesulfonate monooxygenase SsuD/methylene tetrahydromethanopterin reductase-like flavin-dependent oxidoreductase (luciferase family)
VALYRGTVEAAGRTFDPMRIAVARDLFITRDSEETEEALRRRAAGHQRMIDVARRPGQTPGATSGSHVLAWADRPEARTEAALVGTLAEIVTRLHALRDAGVRHLLFSIQGQHRDTLHRLAREVMPEFGGE